MEGLRSKLVPDAKGEHYGKQLDERAVTKGDTGRDYEPRRQESMPGYVDMDSDDDDDEETADEQHTIPSSPQSGSDQFAHETSSKLPRWPPKARSRE